MPEKITLLGKTFGVYCSTHPNEYHDTLSFVKRTDENAMIRLEIKFNIDEWDNYSWEIPINSLLKFEKKLNETGTAVIEQEDNILIMKIKNEKLFYRIKIVNKLFGNSSQGFTANNWLGLKEK